jgi:hypothetical protein
VITLFDLLQQHSAADLAATVERAGIEGFDPFGRQRRFKSGSPEVLDVLRALSAQHEWEQSDVYDQSPADHGLHWPDHPFLRFGWPDDALPDFSSSDTTPKRSGAETRSDDTLLTIIAALAVEVDIDVRKPSATSDLLKLMQGSEFSAPSENTLRKVVFAARDAIGRRSKSTI